MIGRWYYMPLLNNNKKYLINRTKIKFIECIMASIIYNNIGFIINILNYLMFTQLTNKPSYVFNISNKKKYIFVFGLGK